MPEPTPINPLIHLNGSGEKNLKESYEAAAHSLDDFIDEWGKVEFNARDYYVISGEAFTQAAEEREAMAKHIHTVREYLQRIRMDLYEQRP